MNQKFIFCPISMNNIQTIFETFVETISLFEFTCVNNLFFILACFSCVLNQLTFSKQEKHCHSVSWNLKMKFLIIWLQLVLMSTSDNILGIYPIPFHSHLQFQEKIIKKLLHRGHNITVMIDGSFQSHDNLTQIRFETQKSLKEWDFTNFNLLRKWKLSKLWIEMSLKQMKNEKVQKLIHEAQTNNFDLIIFEAHAFDSMMRFAEIYDCPIIISSATDASIHYHSIMGHEVNPELIGEDLVYCDVQGKATILQRLSFISSYINECIDNRMIQMLDIYKKFKYFGMTTESISQIEDRIALLITNTHPALGHVRPTTNRIHAGFFDSEPPKPLLDEALNKFIGKSERGIIFMSFGTMVKTSNIHQNVVETFLRVFMSLNLSVIWKCDENELLQKIPENVFITKWVEQVDLLAHSKMKLFISHGGINSIQEAIIIEVPMLIIPHFFDQYRNAQMMNKKKCAVTLDLNEITEDNLKHSIIEALDPKYKENIRKLHEIVNDQPLTNQELVIWWIENVIKHKGLDHIKYPGRNFPFYRKYFIDLICQALILVFIVRKLLKVFKKRNTVLHQKMN